MLFRRFETEKEKFFVMHFVLMIVHDLMNSVVYITGVHYMMMSDYDMKTFVNDITANIFYILTNVNNIMASVLNMLTSVNNIISSIYYIIISFF